MPEHRNQFAEQAINEIREVFFDGEGRKEDRIRTIIYKLIRPEAGVALYMDQNDPTKLTTKSNEEE